MPDRVVSGVSGIIFRPKITLLIVFEIFFAFRLQSIIKISIFDTDFKTLNFINLNKTYYRNECSKINVRFGTSSPR